MADELQILKNRFKELSKRASQKGIYFYSDFLNLYEQNILAEEVKSGYTLFGGYYEAERKIACFGSEKDFYYPPAPPLKIILIKPLSEKFSDELNHRDFLGSLMGLGIKRETLGDIIITGSTAYIICLETISQYIIDNLFKVRHTSVKCSLSDCLPNDVLPQPKEKVIVVSSPRIDSLISGVYNISRSKSASLIEGEKVFVNGKLIRSNSLNLKTNDLISVRGFGRFKYFEALGDTRKGKLRIKTAIY